MVNLNKMMKQAQAMQSRMKQAQDELAEMECTAKAGGVIEVTARGDNTITAIRIEPQAVDPDDVEGLEDLILTAVNAALADVQDQAEKKMKAVTGGLNLPGMM